ncbi:8816_t:CDS:1, partial [Funneliformis geosporum]
DSGFLLKSWLITPFKDNLRRSDLEKIFNKIHSSMRVVVERAFGKLKAR